MNRDKLMQEIASAGIVGTLAALINALMTKNATLLQRVKNFVAGVAMAILMAILLIDAPLKDFWKNVIIGSSSAFISTIWPLLEIGISKIIKKKTNDYIKGDNDN